MSPAAPGSAVALHIQPAGGDGLALDGDEGGPLGVVVLRGQEQEELADLLRGLLPQIREKTLLAYGRRILNAFDRETGTSDSKTQPVAALLLEPLSAQEQKVLRLLAAGNSNAEIARELIVSVNTVRTQVQSIYRKLNVNNRVAASEMARHLRLL